MMNDDDFWISALRENAFNFHDASVDRIVLDSNDINFFLGGVYDHHYDPGFYRRYSPPVGNIILKFNEIKSVIDLPPEEIWNHLEVFSNNLLDKGVFEVQLAPDPYAQDVIGILGFWRTLIHAVHFTVIASEHYNSSSNKGEYYLDQHGNPTDKGSSHIFPD